MTSPVGGLNGGKKDAKEYQYLKQEAVSYFRSNGVPQKIENILNIVLVENPADIYGRLATYFECFTKKAAISQVTGRLALNANGQLALQTDLYCTVKNHSKLISQVFGSGGVPLSEGSRPEDGEVEWNERKAGLTSAVDILSEHINPELCGIHPDEQTLIDTALLTKWKVIQNAWEEGQGSGSASPVSNHPATPTGKDGKKKLASGKKGKSAHQVVLPEEPKEKFSPGRECISATSQAVCHAAATVLSTPLYDHIATLFHSGPPIQRSMKLPQPLITILQAGRGTAGKLRCVKEFMILPLANIPQTMVVQASAQVFHYISNTLCSKSGALLRLTTDQGALCPPMDKPEQGIDMLQEALSHCGLTDKFKIALNCAAHQAFDYEKGRYDVSVGQQKAYDDMVEFWVDLVHRYSSIIALIDPLRKQESEQWHHLSERLGSQCLVIADYACPRSGKLLNNEAAKNKSSNENPSGVENETIIERNEEITDTPKGDDTVGQLDVAEEMKDLQQLSAPAEQLNLIVPVSGVVLRMQDITTITDIINCTRKLHDHSLHVVLVASGIDSGDTFMVDMAVGVGCSFVKIGAPASSGCVACLNRLADIENKLTLDKCLLSVSADIVFPPPIPKQKTFSVDEQQTDQ